MTREAGMASVCPVCVVIVMLPGVGQPGRTMEKLRYSSSPGRPARHSRRASTLSGSVGEDEGHLHVHPIGGDLAVLDHDFLVLDPGALDVLEGLGGAVDAHFNGVLKALL